MKFKMSSVPNGIGFLLLVLGVVVFTQGGSHALLLIITAVLLFILGALLDIHAALMRR